MDSKPKALLVDVNRCIGCRACVLACKEAHRLPGDETATELSEVSLTAMVDYGDERALGGRYTPSFYELLVSLMLVSIGFAAFALAVRFLPVFPAEPVRQTERPTAPSLEEDEPAADLDSALPAS